MNNTEKDNRVQNQVDIDEYARLNAFMTYNHVVPVCAENGESRLELDVTDDSLNLMGFIHGGLLYTMTDCAAGMAARTDGRRYVTLSSNINFIRNVKTGKVICTGRVLSSGKSVTIVKCSVTSEDGTLLCEATSTMYCVSR